MPKDIQPLRLVIGFRRNPTFPELLQEVYECGHARSPKQDAYGETNALRRRCGKCRQRRPADLEPDEIASLLARTCPQEVSEASKVTNHGPIPPSLDQVTAGPLSMHAPDLSD